MRLRKTILFTLLSLLVSSVFTHTFAQVYDFVILDGESGISGTQVNDIAQDADGYIWVATNSGVSRFDGNAFVNFNEKNGLAENLCATILCDSQNRVWVGHQTGGISIIHTDSIQIISEENGLTNNEVHDIFQTENGDVWVATFGGISIFDGKNWSSLSTADGLASNNIQVICQDTKGAMWVGTYGAGISILNNGKVQHLHMGNGLINNYVTSFNLNKNSVLIGTLGGASTWQNGNIKREIDSNIQSNSQINGISITSNGAIWLATFNGASRISDGLILNINETNGLPQNEVLSVFIDIEDNVWLGTNSGLVRIKNLAFSHYFSTEDIDIDPSSLFVDSKGKLWIGNEAGGVLTFDGEMFVSAFDDPDINDHQISSISEDGDGNLWFGTMDFGGLFQWDGQQLYIYSDEFGLADNNINCLLTDDDGVLLIGTPNGLSIYDGMDFEIVSLSNDLSANNVSSLAKTKDGAILIGTENGAVYVYRNGEAIEHTQIDSESRITDITETAVGTAFGTQDDGIWIISDDKTIHINEENGLHSASIRSLHWAEGALYVGTGQGIEQIVFADDTFRIKKYTRAEGFLGGSCKNGAIVKYGQDILIGTDKGITRFAISELQADLLQPKTQLTELQLSYESVNWSGMGYKTHANGLPEDLVLSYTENNLRFFFRGIDHKQPEGVQYQWMLEGYEKDWTPYSNQQLANYPSLPPGDYTFKLIACNSAEICTEPISFSFVIQPPFWQTVWFYVLFALGVIAITYFYIKRRERVLLKEKQILESTVEERTKELREQKEIVESQNRHITEGIEYASDIQKAILPSEEEMNTAFNEHFVFYRPKETVGGDFYWTYQSNGVAWAAAVDCTGHGVAGAFMSMIGSDLLNQIIIEKKIKDPALVLQEMDKGIKLAFAQSAKEFESDQGMDVSLIRIDKKAKTLQFAGAQRPLFMFVDGELNEIEGDRYSISCADETDKTFKSHTLEYSDGSTVFLFSDGITDQFGGPKGKKFMVRRMREFLLENNSQSMKEQHAAIIKTFDDWKGLENNQIDDVMLMGIRL